jgi:VWFA-related protein
MTRPLLAVLLALLSGASATDARQEPQQFRAGNNTVSIYATVVDRDGRLATDLAREDFEVFDNGVRQDLTVFSNAPQPITIVVLLDRSESVEAAGFYSLVRDAAHAFVAQLREADRARIGHFGFHITIKPDQFTSEQRELARLLDEETRGGGATPLWTATARAMDALREQSGRRVVLVFTDGYDNPSATDAFTPFSTVSDRAQTEEIMVYGIGLAQQCDPKDTLPGSPVWNQGRGRGGSGMGRQRPRPPIRIPGLPPILTPPTGPGTPRPPVPLPPKGPSGGTIYVPCVATQPDAHLKQLAEVGGGGYFELKRTADLRATFARVADELHQQYLLAFTAPVLDGTTHTLDVRVKNPDLTVRARKGYLAR